MRRRFWSLVLLLFLTASQLSEISARHNHIKFRHGRHRRQHGEGYVPSSFVPDSHEPEEGLWGPWSAPSPCSRHCGGGVSHQTRRCLDVDDYGQDRCTGAKKRWFSCNIQPCANATDFRAEQCAEFNTVPFEGVFYDWIPYTGGPNKCELNCMPKGERFFYRHKLQVIDGTPCDLEKNDVCVEGKCLPVGCDMMLGSDAREDACRECGGDGTDCNTVEGLFDTDDLQVGYIDILLIPEGATNIVVREISPSNNYLAIRNTSGHYYLNGNWRIDFPRSLRFAGTIFHYSRDPQGFSAPDTITALGPTTEPIYIVLLYQDHNVGVRYEYSIPRKFSQGDPEGYTWTADEFSECSATCGGGYQSRLVMCVRRRDNEQVEDHLCDPQLEPDDTQSCNEQSCPPEWIESDWGPCTKQCGDNGEQYREIRCQQLVAGGVPAIVDESICAKVGPKGETTRECNRNVTCPQWHLGPWKPCDHLCGMGKQTRKVTCYKKNEAGKIFVLDDSACEGDVPEKEKPCELRPCAGLDWVVSEWSGCDETCGLTQETRTVRCATQDGTVYPDEKCDPEKKPELSRNCENPKRCDYQWFTTQWSECSAKCGTGVQTRKVFCGTFEDDVTLKKVEDDKCNPKDRYNDTKECVSEVTECKGEWFAGPWSECSKPCGSGDRMRKVICMKDEKVVDVKNCDPDLIMFSSEECNKDPCDEDQTIPVEPSQPTVPTDEEDDCLVYEDEEVVSTTLGDEEETKSTPSGITDFTETMMSDGPFRGDISPFDEGSGEGSGSDDFLSTIFTESSIFNSEFTSIEGSGTTDELEFTDVTDKETEEGSGTSEFPETTEFGVTEVTSESSGATDGVTESSDVTEGSGSTSESSEGTTEASGATEESSEAATDVSEDVSGRSAVTEVSSEGTEGSEGTTEVSATSDVSSEASEVTEASTEQPTTLDSSESSTISSVASESSEDTTVDATTSSDVSSSEMTTSSDSESDATTVSSASESTQTDVTESTETTVTEETETTESSEATESTSESSTDATSTESSTGSSEAVTTTESGTESTTELFTIPPVGGEYDPDNQAKNTDAPEETTGSSDDETTVGSTESSTDSSTESSTDVSTESSETTTSSDVTTEGSTDSSSESSTVGESEGTTELSGSSESGETTEASETTESGLTSESGETTESGSTTESGETTESDQTTESGLTTEATSDVSTDVTETTESGTTEGSTTEESTVSGETTETGLTTESAETTESSSTDETTEEDLTETTSILDLFTTISPVDQAITKEHKLRKCKIRRQKTCKTSTFGCCYDGVTAAKGPFGKGCPTPATCNETQYGCCPDGVSVAAGPKNEDCPSQHCEQTLFGCCQDGVTPAEGNDFEGCKKPCNQTEFGCCPDEETPALGKDNLGCCNVTEHGCCPDGIKPASGPDGEGCEVEVTTEPSTDWTEVTGEWETTTEPITQDCASSTYGCCPDGKTSATGPNFDGCGVINHENCTASYFGCCADNITAALGSDNEGCREKCDDSTHGCCPDRVTPAHGPNGEGCCLTSPYGCCPDNIAPARGPDLYGCGCEYSRFRCCPDNTTAARGPNNEGCGCQYTQHGCCPNRFTPASGPNFEGCPCYTYQFGCCPDGVTIAKGPRSQGCGCENTEFKCCSDGRTPAKGPNFAGCTCDASKYGCCPDGIEEAQGENFEGCRTVPAAPQAACSLERDRGSCRDFTVKWFFDTEYGGCSRFWYGGCEGNDNRFATQEECKSICVAPQGKDVCKLPKSPGPCEGYYPTWYYDAERKQCGQFIYGGCLGNENKFKTREECEGLCVVRPDADPCTLDQDVGPCQGNFTRFFFNKETQTCEEFKYGGCKGNTNNFPTHSACQQQCLQPGHSRVSCSLPRTEGNCNEKQSRWYFDQSENRCMPFYYTGCGGNRNNFESREACENDCPPKIEQDICLLPAQLGECHNYTQRWFFDSYEQRCRQFYYGGCGGNENNFVTEQDCQNRCESTGITGPPPKETFSPAMCFLPDEHGPCTQNQTKWFYDSRDGICKQFVYGGCASNGNKFDTREECEYRCGEVQEICDLPKVIGPCAALVPQFYYDRSTDSCEQFDYSGCGGNKNRFQDRESCESRCQRRPRPQPQPTQPPSPPVTEIIPSSPICSAPADAGPCRGDFTTYYYDAQSQRCQAFIYGGCGGNANRFQTEEQCERLCGRFQGQDMCSQQADPGPCRGSFPKFYYDSSARTCRQFFYGGCDGNANRFSTQSECESVCIHREEPAPAGNDTSLSHLEICRERVDVGSCPTGSYKRFYFDEERQTCMAFVYTGCGGNRNRFKTFESCMQTCYRTSNEIDVDNRNPSKDPCTEAREECAQLRCAYGKEEFVDDQDCERCRCSDPCRNIQCQMGTRCSIILEASADGGTEYRGQCISVTKSGDCPVVSNSTRCEVECRDDADCAGDRKCCSSGCGTSCLEPLQERPAYTPPPYTAPPDVGEPAYIRQPEKTDVTGEEGNMVIMSCFASGDPVPTIVWKKDHEIIQIAEERRAILPDGSLRITNLYPSDAGVYICSADNGLAPPARIEYKLEITDPHDHATAIVGEQNTAVTVTMNSPTTLYCYAMGWPRPAVTWWHGDRMLPLNSENYEQNPEYSLLIRSVTISNLGVYTCQAFNGIERPASWAVTLQAIGPVYNVKPEHQEYLKYLVQPPKPPIRPQYPYRPARTQPPDYNITYAPIYTVAPPYKPPPVVPLTDIPLPSQPPPPPPPTPVKFKVPVAVNVTSSGSEFPVGSEISIGCAVDGYPIPRVLWFKDDDLIRTDGRVTISESNRLTITNAGYNDTGKYRCEAANEYSSASSELEINVSGVFIHPDCQDNTFFAKCDLIVKAKYCQHKYYAKFCCRSCTEAGQLPPNGPHLSNLVKRRRRSSKFLF